jgi:hypothetical protein
MPASYQQLSHIGAALHGVLAVLYSLLNRQTLLAQKSVRPPLPLCKFSLTTEKLTSLPAVDDRLTASSALTVNRLPLNLSSP